MSSMQASQDGEGLVFTLRDGTSTLMEELRAGDESTLEEFVDHLSEEAIYHRFLGAGIARDLLLKELSPKPQGFTLVALIEGKIVGHCTYFRSGSETAEIGLLILDEYQGKGLGTGMIERIAHVANGEGISMFEAVIGWNNTRMIRLVRNMGFPTSERVEPDLIRIRFPTSINPVSIAEFQDKWVFRPDS